MARRKRGRNSHAHQVATVNKPALATFDIAQTNNLNKNHWANADSLSSRAAISPAVRRVVRIRSRYEADNNSWYAGMLRTAVNHIIGNGPRLQLLSDNTEANRRVEAAFQTWARSIDLADKLRTMFEAYWRDGEVFAMRVDKPQAWPMSLDIRTYETEQVASPWDQSILGDRFIDDGVRFDGSTNETEFYIYDNHPGSNVPVSTLTGKWYPAADVLHLFRAERPGQTRGLPRATPALPMLPIMRRHHLATLNVAESAANWGMYLKSNSPSIDPTLAPADFAEYSMARNMMTILPAGWEPGVLEAKQPGPVFESFQKFTLQAFCRCTNMPYPLAAGTAEDSNFSSFKGDIRNIWQPEVNVEQNRVEISIIERIFKWWIDAAVYVPGLLDGLPPIALLQRHWRWPPLPDVDPMDTANTNTIKLSTGQATPTSIHAAQGQDWEQEAASAANDFGVDVQTYKRAVFAKQFGLDPNTIASATPQAQQAAASQGEYTQLGQRAFSNNLKRIRQTLDQLASGDMSRVMAEQTLASIGLTSERIDALIQDALDGQVSDSELQNVTANLCEGRMLYANAKQSKIRFAGQCDIKASAQNRRFTIKAYSGGPLNVGGFDLPVIVDLTGLETPGSIPILIDHKNTVETTLGHTDQINVTQSEILLAGPITTEPITSGGAHTPAQQVVARKDHAWQASIGALVVEAQEVPAGRTVDVNGRTFEGPVIVARRSVLRETSVLAMGADATTQVSLAAAGKLGRTAMTFEQWLQSLGFDKATLSEQQLASMQLKYQQEMEDIAPETPAAPASAPAVATASPQPAAAAATLNLQATLRQVQDQINASAAATLRRHAEIKAKAGGNEMIAAKAIDEGWSLEKVELEVLKASAAKVRPSSFRTSESDPAILPQVLEAALCTTRRINDTEKKYEDRVLQAAHSKFRGGIGIKRLLIEAAVANGHHIAPGEDITRSNWQTIGRAAWGNNLEAGFSTVSLPGILSNVANKELLQGYLQEEQSWREVAGISSVNDFKSVTSYRLLDDMEYEEVGPTGTIKHGTVSEESYTRQARTYAKMFQLTRTQIINDDLGAFDQLRNVIGRGAAKKLNKVFWTKWLDNASFFTAARGNYIEGATTTLLTDFVGLELALAAFDNLRTPAKDGNKVLGSKVGGTPTILLTPGGSISLVAERIYANANLGAGTTTANANIHAGKYKPVKSVYLGDSTFSNYSTTAWYLLRDPSVHAGVVVSFLNGVETPTIEQDDAEFSTLGIQMRGYHDFGCDQAEYLCGVKSKGAA